MSSKSRRHGRSTSWAPGKWKLIDDRSGFVITSDKAIIDDKGRITSKNNHDPINYLELPIDFPVDQPVPYTRMEAPDQYIVSNYEQLTPNTYNDKWLPQPPRENLVELTPNSNPTMAFANYQEQSTFGNTWTNNGNTIVDLPTTGRYQSWGDSYAYFASDAPRQLV